MDHHRSADLCIENVTVDMLEVCTEDIMQCLITFVTNQWCHCIWAVPGCRLITAIYYSVLCVVAEFLRSFTRAQLFTKQLITQ